MRPVNPSSLDPPISLDLKVLWESSLPLPQGYPRPRMKHQQMSDILIKLPWPVCCSNAIRGQFQASNRLPLQASKPFSSVPGVGLEPTRPFGQRILSPPRLPFRHPGEGENSTGSVDLV